LRGFGAFGAKGLLPVSGSDYERCAPNSLFPGNSQNNVYFVMASSYSRMPGIRDQLGSTPTQLAFALVCMGIGSILGMPITGRLVDQYSSRMISLVATVICLGGWAALPIPADVPQICPHEIVEGRAAFRELGGLEQSNATISPYSDLPNHTDQTVVLIECSQ
jgi:hypothetical protein